MGEAHVLDVGALGGGLRNRGDEVGIRADQIRSIEETLKGTGQQIDGDCVLRPIRAPVPSNPSS